SAARATSSRSSSSTAPASAAIPRSPASAATETVRGPSVGRSTRLSCPGFSALTSTPPGPGRCKPAQRRTSASVPSIASTPSTMPCWTTTDWPISSAPTARAMRSPCAISASARGSGTSAPTGPSGIAAVSAKSWSGPITRKPSLSISLITAERSPSSPRARSPIRAKNLAARQSGRSEAIDGRCTPPARTSSPTPLARSRSKPAAAAPIRHQACGTSATVSGSASPSSARTKTARPSLRHFSITRRGNPPLPATMPSGPAPLAVIRPFGLADRPARIGANERDHIVDRADPGKLRGRLLDPLAEGAAAVGEQELIGGAQTLDVVAAEPAALHSDDVEAGQPGAVAHHQPIWDHVALDPGHAADHRVPPDAYELLHRRQPAEDRVILDHHVAAERRVVDEDHVVADLAVMRDMRADHQQAMVADARDHAAAGGARVDRDMLADRVVAADLQRGRLAGVFQVLGLGADRGKREDTGAGADRRAAVNHDMGLQRHAGAQSDVPADHAIGADRDIVG